MAEPARLSEVQKRTLRLTLFEDGSWDLMMGVIFLMLAIYPVTRARLGPAWNLALFVGLLLIVVAAQWFVRQRISPPRLGYAKPRRSPWLKPVMVIAAALVVLTFGLVILTLVSPAPDAAPGGSRSYWVEVVALLVLVGLFSGMGYLVGVPRLFIYGWLVGGGYLASVLLNTGAPERLLLPLALAAGIILAIGVGLLIRFIRKYRVQSPEA